MIYYFLFTIYNVIRKEPFTLGSEKGSIYFYSLLN